MNIKIQQITTEQALIVRAPVLRKNQPIERASIIEDNFPETIHVGAFMNNDIIGTSTIYPENRNDDNNEWRLRGMAILENYQSKGIGGKLLNECFIFIKLKHGEILWCNARIKAVNFYIRFGFSICSQEFDIPTIGPHFQMEKKI
jgi:predicted GNAT family N-acyltransferase